MNNKPIFVNSIYCNKGQKKSSVEQGGEYILEMLLNKYLIHNIYFNREYDGYAQTYKYIYNFIDKYFILNLGGDHSIGAATVQPLLDKYEDDVLIIWIDAHADINTQETSVTKNTHGMPVSCLFNLMPHWYQHDIKSKQHILKPSNLVYIGIRDLDPPETDFINKLNIKHSNVLTEDILNFIKSHPAKKIHISLDIDGLDPELTPSTGTIAPNGLTAEDVLEIINLSKDRLISMDIVEFNPWIGTLEEVVDTLYNICIILEQINVV